MQRKIVEGVVKPYGKTDRSRRRVPLSDLALAAIDELPIRLGGGPLFTAPEGGYLSLRNWRRRTWRPALQAAGLALCTCGHLSGEHEPGKRCEHDGCRCRAFRYDTGAA